VQLSVSFEKKCTCLGASIVVRLGGGGGGGVRGLGGRGLGGGGGIAYVVVYC
jgi:hypothetical protein